MEIPYTPFSTMASSRCTVHGYKPVNYHNAVAGDIRFIWQKMERNLNKFYDRSSSLSLILLLVKHKHFSFHNHHHL